MSPEQEARFKPYVTCLEDADLLDRLWLRRTPRHFSISREAEIQHSRQIFEDLISKHERCHEALFGLGRLLLLEGRHEDASLRLERAVGLRQDATYMTWYAWALLLSSGKVGVLKRTDMLWSAGDYCQRALDASPDFPLALRCLIHLSFATPMKSSGGRATALSYAKRLAEVQPIAGLGVLGRVLLEDSKQAETAAQALKDCLLTVPLDREAAERAAVAAVAQCSGNVEVVMPGSVMAGPSLVSSAKPRRVPVAFPRTAAGSAPSDAQTPKPQPSAAKMGPLWDRHVMSTKMLALDTVWRQISFHKFDTAKAVETVLQAVSTLRLCPAAWQRAVCIAMKALAFQGRWDECWRFVAAQLSFHPSREVVYQCGRLAFFDGRREPVVTYLPHLHALLSVSPIDALPDVQFWIGMLEQKCGHGMVAVQHLQAVMPMLHVSRAGKKSKLDRAQGIIKLNDDIEKETIRIYQFSNTVWAPLAKRHRDESDLPLAPITSYNGLPPRTPLPATSVPGEAVEREDGSMRQTASVPPKADEWSLWHDGEDDARDALGIGADAAETDVETDAQSQGAWNEPPPYGGGAEEEAGDVEASTGEGNDQDLQDDGILKSQIWTGNAETQRAMPDENEFDIASRTEHGGEDDFLETHQQVYDYSDHAYMARAQRRAAKLAEARPSFFTAPWNMYTVWRGENVAAAIDKRDPYLGKLCQARLAVSRGKEAEAEKLLQTVAELFPMRLEPYVELWLLHTFQGAHKKAVLDIRQAVDMVSSGRSDWGQYLKVDVHLLLNGKEWPGAGSGLGMHSIVHLLLAKSLRRCRLWENAWEALLTGRSGETAAAGAFLFQAGKLCVHCLNQLLVESNAQGGTSAADLGTGTKAERAELGKWLDRGREQLGAYLDYERNETDRVKGGFYRKQLSRCAQLVDAL